MDNLQIKPVGIPNGGGTNRWMFTSLLPTGEAVVSGVIGSFRSCGEVMPRFTWTKCLSEESDLELIRTEFASFKKVDDDMQSPRTKRTGGPFMYDKTVRLFDTIAEMAEFFDSNMSEDVFPASRLTYAVRDTFYGNLKYGHRRGFLTDDDVIAALSREPDVKQDLIYVYFSTYAAWLSRELGVAEPSWYRSARSMMFAGWNITFTYGPVTLSFIMSEAVPEFFERGILMRERDLLIA